jgi:hypothetical protein
MSEIIAALNNLSWPGAFALVGMTLAIAWMIK